MKTNSRVFVLGIGFVSLVLCVGCQEDQAKANGPLIANAVLTLATAEADAKPAAPAPATPAAAKPAEAPATPAIPPGSIIITNRAAASATNATPAGPPALSPALAEVVRLLEANVGQDVVMTYITNSTLPFNIGANEIVYLHDLGVPASLITTLINIDSSPEMVARKQAATAVKPLPPGVALNEPATNVFSPQGPNMAVASPPEPVAVELPGAANVAYVPGPPPDGEVPYDVAPPVTEVSYSYFYTSLAPYGTWCDVPGYGYAWRPTCATWNSSWQPYGDCGRWLWSNQGWYWYSDYSWGWAPFHYGRWCRPAGYGWCWVPDTCWGPSWVSWRYSPNYCGWAPLPPAACYTTGVGFSYHSGAVGIGFEFGLGAADYCYVPTSRFCDRRPYDYCVPAHRNHAVHKETTVVNNYIIGDNNTIVNNGAGFDRIAKVTRGDIKQVALRDTTSMKSLGTRHDRLEADGKTLSVYRPPTATLAHKSVVPAPKSAGTSVVRPTSRVKPTPVSSYAGNVSFSEPAATRLPTAQAPGKSIYIGKHDIAPDPRTTPKPVNVYTRPADAGRQPVIVTGGTPAPVQQYTKPAAASSLAAQPSGDFDGPAIQGSKASAPSLAGKSGSAPSSVQLPSPGYTKPAPGSASSSSPKVSSTPALRAPGQSPIPGASAPKVGQNRVETSGGYQKPGASPVARSGGPAVSTPPPSAPAQNYTRPAPSAPPAQNVSRPAPSYSVPARVESHQSRVAAPSAPAPSAPASVPRASAPSGGNSGGNSGGGGKSSGSYSVPSQSGGKGR